MLALVAVDVAGLDVPVIAGMVEVAAAGCEDELAIQVVEMMEKLVGRTDTQKLPQQAIPQAELLPCAFELQAFLPQSDQIHLSV